MFFIDWILWSSIRHVGINNQEQVRRLFLIRFLVMIFWCVALLLTNFLFFNDINKFNLYMTILLTCYVCFHIIISRLINRYMYKNPKIVDNREILEAQQYIYWTNIVFDLIYLIIFFSFLYMTFVANKKTTMKELSV